MTQIRLSNFEGRDMSTLSPTERKVYEAVEMGSSQPADVAYELGMTASTARTHLWRARGKLGERDGL